MVQNLPDLFFLHQPGNQGEGERSFNLFTNLKHGAKPSFLQTVAPARDSAVQNPLFLHRGFKP